MSELIHRIKVFVFQQAGPEPHYLLLCSAQGIECLWGPVHGTIGFGEKLENAIRREVMDDIGLGTPLDLIDLQMPARWVVGDEEVIEWAFGYRTQNDLPPLALCHRPAPNKWAPSCSTAGSAPTTRISTPLELTLKLWAAYAGDSLGPRVLDSIAAHIRRLAPSGTPVAALELLAMQVILTSQPLFDSNKARAWVKHYEVVDDQPAGDEEDPSFKTVTAEKIALTDSQRIKLKKSKTGDVPSTGLLGKIIESGLVVSHANSKLRFLHPVLNGYLAGQAIGDNETHVTLAAQPEWDGKTLAMYYLAARSDATAIADLPAQRILPAPASQ